ncbi:Serine carboxypeptidase [Gemmata sp. SH-PL17]|uniref:S10 family peptidase n=1 Tax=Gemmata sp. SH-PL17 TaxID=1630693 RepID=UPI00078BBE3D|nr:hypothetical protein [Gemmata sp. SH-PL17]AMV25213.1 Serine carboxypeptidase [Gemmata sp. SH-PL17]
MASRRYALLAAFLIAAVVTSSAAQQGPPPKGDPPKGAAATKDEKSRSGDDKKGAPKVAAPEAKDDKKAPPTVTTDGSVIIAGQKVEYKATTGTLPGTDKTGKAKANIFYMAYTRKSGDAPSARPLTFCFNGGPGSASSYVHLGFFGPRRVLINNDGLSAPSPAELVDNECSLLDVTDLVFIDPVSTGLSRAEVPGDAKLFHGLEEDTQSVGDFIRDYAAKFGRQGSPVYVAGESYGTTRAASLSAYLQNRGGVKVAGIVLISTVLDFQTIRFGGANELPYALFLPTYTATAFHHGKLDKKWAVDLPTALRESQKYAAGAYLEVLHKGALLTEFERQAAAKQLALLTGLSEEFVLRSDLRVEATRFRSELLRDQQTVVGRYDARVSAKVAARPAPGNPPGPTGTPGAPGTSGATGAQGTGAPTGTAVPPASGPGGGPGGPRGERIGGGDPSAALLSPLFTAAMRQYLPDGLGYKSESAYVLSAPVQPWNYGPAGTNQYANVAPRLRSALEKDKGLRVFVASGYTDLATPFAATNYTFAHLGPRALMDRVTMAYYDAGHMMYTHEPSRKKLREDLRKFITAPIAEPATK